MKQLKTVRKSVKREAIKRGLLPKVAQATGKTTATVSRTLWGKFDTPNEGIVAAIWHELREMGLMEDAA